MATSRTVTLDWSRLKATLLEGSKGKLDGKNVERREILPRWRKNEDKSWTGCSLSQMLDWLKDGYHAGEFEFDTLTNSRPRRRIKFSEEGEVQVDLALSGSDYPFLTWENRKRKPGLQVDVGFQFSAINDAKTLEQYGAWLAKTLAGLETKGYSLGITFTMSLSRFTQSYNGTTDIKIMVKDEKEAGDFSDFSALFSPGGFRMLGFLAMALVADDLKEDLAYGLGRPVNKGWNCTMDENTRTLSINCDGFGSVRFPEADMTRQIESIPTL